MAQHERYDLAVMGSGFSGCLLAWIMSNAGRRVIVLDRARHPRFAIGESSTPLADFLLEQMADEFGLSTLKPLSRWGSWQQELPSVRAGKKRGFSYFAHTKGMPFSEGPGHEASLLVAASTCDELSDTHWLRSDVDHWFCQQAKQYGAIVLEEFELRGLTKHPDGWQLEGSATAGSDAKQECFTADFLIDSTGGSGVLGKQLGIDSYDDRLQTNNAALFGHFKSVGNMSDWLRAKGFSLGDDPFDADDAAQHHLIDNGWIWMLRFRDETTSVGIVKPQSCFHFNSAKKELSAEDLTNAWQCVVDAYPTVCELLSGTSLVAPHLGGRPCLGWIPRISRLRSNAAGVGWAMLPGTAGIVDPLHSAGIAHALSGVQRIARLLLSDASPAEWHEYSRDVISEILWIDRLVNCAYTALNQSFELFASVCSLYFVAAIGTERRLASHRDLAHGFLLHHSTRFQETVASVEQKILAARLTIEELRGELEPWNDVGLLDPSAKNRFGRTAAPK